MDATSTAVLSAFSVVLGQQEGDRRSAEQNLTALEVLDSYPVILVNLVSDEQATVDVRQLAAVTLKRYVCSHWSRTECQPFTPPETTEEAKSHVRTVLLRTLPSPIRLVRTAVAHTIAAIAQFDWPDAWPTLLTDITSMIDQVAGMGQDASCMDRSKALVHGCIRVLAAISGEISDLDVPKIAPVLVPSLMRVVCDKQRFGTATRRNALVVMNNLIDTVVSSDGEDSFNRFISPHLRPCMNVILSDLTEPKLLLEESAFQSELIQLLTYLCTELRDFVGSCLQGGLGQLMTILWQMLLRISDTFVQSKVAVRSIPGELHEEPDVVDSDGETVEYEGLVYSLLELLSGLAAEKRYRSKLVHYLPDVCFQLARLMQLPEDAISRWTNGLADFMEETEEVYGCSVRLTTLDVLLKFAGRFSNWTEAFHTTVSRLFALAEEQHAKSDPSWWKLLEVSLYLCASFPNCFSTTKSSRSSSTPSEPNPLALDLIYTRYVLPSLQQSDYPFVQVSALHCATELALHGISNGPRLSDLPVLLVGALAQGQHAVLRASAVREVGVSAVKFRHLFNAANSGAAPQDSAQLLISHLPDMVTGVVDCLSQFGEPLLMDGLDALCGLLRVDRQGFTRSARSQVTTILVELFKHCFSVAGTLSLYLDVLRVVCQAADPESTNEPIEQAFLPTLSTCLEQPDTVDTVAIEAALQVLCVLIETSRPTVSNLLIQRLFPVVVHIAISNTDSMVISGCCEVLRCYLAVGVDQVLDWHDDEGNNGIGYILHVTSRLLDPTGPVERATAGGRLVSAILLRLQSHQLGENLDLLLRGTLARLSTLPLAAQSEECEHAESAENLDDDLESGSVRGARQSLLFVFVLLFRLQPEAAINFLSNVPDLSGQPVMATVLRLWCAAQPLYVARPQLLISIFALSNLLSHAIATKDERLMQITVEVDDLEELGVAGSSAAARTRSKRKSKSHSQIQVPILVVMYKLLLGELAKQLEEAEAEDDDDEGIDDDDDEEDDEEEEEKGAGIDAHGDADGANRRSRHPVGKSGVNGAALDSRASAEQLDVDSKTETDDGLESDDPIYATDPLMSMNIKEHLCTLLRNLSQQPFYNEFSRYHTETELSALRRAHIVDVAEDA